MQDYLDLMLESLCLNEDVLVRMLQSFNAFF